MRRPLLPHPHPSYPFSHAASVTSLSGAFMPPSVCSLLAPAGPAAALADEKHEIRHDKDGNTTVTGVVSVAVDSVVGIEALLSRAGAARATGATASNSASSRSHSVFVLRIAMRHEATAQTRHGVLNLIDLAGSEVRTCD